MRTESNVKARYIDYYSRWCEVKFIKTKDEVLEFNMNIELKSIDLLTITILGNTTQLR